MALLQVHTARAAEMLDYISDGLQDLDLNDEMPTIEHIRILLVQGRLDLLLSQEPKSWFFGRPMHTEIDKNWKVYWVLHGYTKDQLDPTGAKYLMEDLHGIAERHNCSRVLFNDRSKYLMSYLNFVGGDLWQQVKW